MKPKWSCEEVKRKERDITNKEMQEKLERVWEVLQSLDCQPTDLSRQETAVSVRVKGSTKRSAS